MTLPAIQSNLLRRKGPDAHHRVTYLELFFDLVFVFAITQISHFLLHHLTLAGAVQTAFLALAVWWVWVFTSWVTNWLDPDKTPVRLLLLGLMLAGLILSTSLTDAFGEKGLIFAVSYVFMQLGRSVFTLLAVKNHNAGHYRNFQRITSWFAVSAIFWIMGGIEDGWMRYAFWGAALLIEYLSPICGFWTPFIGKSQSQDWDVEGGHMSERCALFIIIALGESILVTGATFAEIPWSGESITAFLAAFFGSVALWWIYFDTGVERGADRIKHADNPGRLARMGYTYIHTLIVGGIVVCAVGDEMALLHPHAAVGLGQGLILFGGPALFLIGNILFKSVIAGRPPLSHMAGLGGLLLLAFIALDLTVLQAAIGGTTILVIVALWETFSLRGPWQKSA